MLTVLMVSLASIKGMRRFVRTVPARKASAGTLHRKIGKTVGPMWHRKASLPASPRRRPSCRQARHTLFPNPRAQRVACRWRVCCRRTTRKTCQRAPCQCILARPCSRRVRTRITVGTCQRARETTCHMSRWGGTQQSRPHLNTTTFRSKCLDGCPALS
jgi:hypothetical protein